MAGGFTRDHTMSTRHHANTRGQRHQWHAGLTACTVYAEHSPSTIACRSCSDVSCFLAHRGWYCSIVAGRSWRGLVGLRHHIQSQVLALLASLSELTLRIFVPIILGTTCPIGCVLLQHRVENFCQCMGRRCGGCGWPQCAPHTAKKRPQRAGACAETLRGHAQGAPGPLLDPSPPRGPSWATTELLGRTEAQPGRKMFVGRPCMPIEAHLGKDNMDRGSLQSRYLCEVDAGDPVEMGTEIQGGCVALRAPLRGRRRG